MRLILILVVIGSLMIWNASFLGQALVPRIYTGPASYYTKLDDAQGIATSIRLLGALVFATGLVERLVITIREVRKP